MTAKTPASPAVRCSTCGAKFTVVADDCGVSLTYDVDEWRTKCRSDDLGSPGLCRHLGRKLPLLQFQLVCWQPEQ